MENDFPTNAGVVLIRNLQNPAVLPDVIEKSAFGEASSCGARLPNPTR
ncbi:hypothetical protein Fuma_02838 [Fuerstiella marisgermanici]|uniref:Uncharacterized protein n=1 Tax=Fuerstiella marisgermanici TaxID=1891926 RepID=A0A1P8WGL9_9PLAN|nr:hypothetical protein Fuma_02838 [Fuerstiella marisgermanici]